jgi:hypothetical protein
MQIAPAFVPQGRGFAQAGNAERKISQMPCFQKESLNAMQIEENE